MIKVLQFISSKENRGLRKPVPVRTIHFDFEVRQVQFTPTETSKQFHPTPMGNNQHFSSLKNPSLPKKIITARLEVPPLD